MTYAERDAMKLAASVGGMLFGDKVILSSIQLLALVEKVKAGAVPNRPPVRQ